jgi:hypothetical protein
LAASQSAKRDRSQPNSARDNSSAPVLLLHKPLQPLQPQFLHLRQAAPSACVRNAQKRSKTASSPKKPQNYRHGKSPREGTLRPPSPPLPPP